MRLYIYLFFLAIFSISCNDRVEFNYQDAERNKVEYFFENNSTLRFYHDLDKSVIEGYFQPNDRSKYYSSVDSAAKVNQWVKVIDDSDKMMYIKKIATSYSISTIVFLDGEIHLKMYTF